MPLPHCRRTKLLDGFRAHFQHYGVFDKLAVVLRSNFEEKYACEGDHRVNIVRNAHEPFADVAIRKKQFDDGCGGRNGSDCAVVEVGWNRVALESSEDV